MIVRQKIQADLNACFRLVLAINISIFSVSMILAQPVSAPAATVTLIGDVPAAEILARLGAKFEAGTSLKLLDEYANHFDRTDPNRDGKHTQQEYVERGRYMTAQARAGIFRAADENNDGVVTRSEYVLNRIITDEAKGIIQGMNDSRSGRVEKAELVSHATKLLEDEKLANELYGKLDRNRDGKILVPEYLVLWGQWAREGRGSAKERIAKRREVVATSLSQTAPAAAAVDTEVRGRPGGPPSVEQVFQRFDRDKDGKLVKAEIPEFVRQFILPADANKDDAVTKKELTEFRGKDGAGGPRVPSQGARGTVPSRGARGTVPIGRPTDAGDKVP